MQFPFRSTAALLLTLPGPALAQDVVVQTGETLVYDTTNGPLHVGSLTIEAGGTLRAIGSHRFKVRARSTIAVDGTLDLSGVDAPGVLTLNTANIPELGAAGGPGAGRGGIGSLRTTASTAQGTPGRGSGPNARGGLGGESGFQLVSGNVDERRAAGGGGGAFAPDQPVSNIPGDPANIGLVAGDGVDGSAQAMGAISQVAPPSAGAHGAIPFVDADAGNDYFGRRFDPSGLLIVGELAAPAAGRGGGAGGDAVPSASFPNVPFGPAADEKGAGGGGGGGLGILIARRIVVGPQGEVRADGGSGGGGENTLFFNRVGGGSGAGSGGMLLLQAREIDLSNAGPDSLTALGGRGGPGRGNQHGATGAGGDGGPGLVQLHVPNELQDILLPAGVSLQELTSPDAHVLLPEQGL